MSRPPRGLTDRHEINRVRGRARNLERRFNSPDSGAVFLGPSALMGIAVGGSFLTSGFGLYQGVVYVPDRDGEPLLAGETITVSYAHAAPKGHFHFIAARVHIVNGFTVADYDYVEPLEGDPWAGSIGGHTITDPYPFFGGWINTVTFAAVTNDAGETVSWNLPDDGVTPEQFSFDNTGVGHIGYLVHDFGPVRVPGNVTASFSGASTEREGSTVWCRGSGVTVGDTVAEDVFESASITNHLDMTLTEDVPAGSQLLVVAAATGPTGYDPTDALARPTIWTRQPAGDQVIKFRIDGQSYDVASLITALTSGEGSVDLDGGGP